MDRTGLPQIIFIILTFENDIQHSICEDMAWWSLMRPPGPRPMLSSPPVAVISTTKADCTGCYTREAHSLRTGWEISAFQSPSASSRRKKILIRKVRVLFDGRKICPKLLYGSMGNVSIIELCTSIESRSLSQLIVICGATHKPPKKLKPKPRHCSHIHLTVFTYCSFCLSQLTGQRRNQVRKRGSLPGVKSPTGLHHGIAAEEKTWHRKRVSFWTL